MSTLYNKLRTHPRVKKAKLDVEEFLKTIRTSFNARLFDGSVDFWGHHLGGIAALFSLDLALNSIFAPASVWKFYVFAGVIWVVGFFFAGLILRRQYKDANWEAQPQATVLFKAIACSIFFGLIITLIMSSTSMLFFYDDLYRYRSYDIPGISNLRVIGEFVFRNWFVTSFYLLVWMMLYIGITSRRRAKQIELDNLRLQHSLKEAELSSLSNQLNPHFLFNALNNIRFMIHEDASNAERMLMSLSSVLRYSLESSKQEKVALEQELEMSRRYIELIQIQFEERLRFDLNIPQHLDKCTMPPMVLQMLLENAVKHGIENIREGGVIDVQANLFNNVLTLRVCNDLPEDYKANKTETGIGLLNIGQRLDLLYGGRGDIQAEIIDDQFCVAVVIPQD